MTATYWQRGETLDYVNDTDETIETGTIIDLGTRIAVAGMDIDPSETGSIHVAGVYSITKADTDEIAMGTDLYYGDDGITATSGGTPAGYAAEVSEAGAETILVKLLG